MNVVTECYCECWTLKDKHVRRSRINKSSFCISSNTIPEFACLSSRQKLFAWGAKSPPCCKRARATLGLNCKISKRELYSMHLSCSLFSFFLFGSKCLVLNWAKQNPQSMLMVQDQTRRRTLRSENGNKEVCQGWSTITIWCWAEAIATALLFNESQTVPMYEQFIPSSNWGNQFMMQVVRIVELNNIAHRSADSKQIHACIWALRLWTYLLKNWSCKNFS